MKPLLGITLLLTLLHLCTGCKKDTAENELSGNWRLVNLTGTVTGATGVDTGYYTYSYDSVHGILWYVVTSTQQPVPQTITSAITESWNFISTDTCTVTSAYTTAQGLVSVSNHAAYTLAGSVLFLAAGNSPMLLQLGIDNPPYTGIYDQFKIKSITTSQLMLNYNAQVTDSNSTALVNMAFTFSK